MVEHFPDFYQYEDSATFYKKEFIEVYYEETIYDVWENCIIESIKSVYHSIYKVVIFNIVFGLVTTFGLPEALFHWLSTLCGVYMLLITIQSTVGLMILFASLFLTSMAIFFLLLTQPQCKLKGVQETSPQYLNTASYIQYGFIAMFVLFEYVILDKETWLEIRGIMMVFSMKIISIITELPSSNSLNFSEYCGYMFCPGNVLFGPWISFKHYMMPVKYPTIKNVYWIYGIMKALLCSLIFLSISNCWASYLMGECSNSLLIGYKEAASFRASHYFVCYLSESLMLAAGWKDIKHHFDAEYWHLPVTSFLKIEFPASLAVVVINWNKPMHKFLKKYIYRKWLPSGKFQAVLLTFIMSSLFHGFEIKVSTVLICLGIFSYLQILVRNHITRTFDICVKVHPCKTCQHKLKRDSIICKIALLAFSTLTVLHLIYLGVLMDNSTDDVGIYQKWKNLYFFSLWIVFIKYLLVK